MFDWIMFFLEVRLEDYYRHSLTHATNHLLSSRFSSASIDQAEEVLGLEMKVRSQHVILPPKHWMLQIHFSPALSLFLDCFGKQAKAATQPVTSWRMNQPIER
jgi:hypothetical protein